MSYEPRHYSQRMLNPEEVDRSSVKAALVEATLRKAAGETGMQDDKAPRLSSQPAIERLK